MKLIKRVLRMTFAAILAIAMTVTLIPLTAAPASADENGGWPGMELGSRASAFHLTLDANKSNAQVVWFGGRQWYVIAGDNGIGVLVGNNKVAREGVLTLFQKGVTEQCTYSDDFYPWDYTFQYLKSDLKTFIEGYTSDDPDADHAIFTKLEKSHISGRTLKGYRADDYDEDLIGGDDVENALLWPLTMGQVKQLSDGIRTVDPNGGQKDFWWTGSPGHTVGPGSLPDGSKPEEWTAGPEDGGESPIIGKTCMCYIHAVYLDGGYTYNDPYGKNIEIEKAITCNEYVRPALDLDIAGIIMISAANGGKVSGAAGPGALKAVPVITDGEWKVTLKDSARNDFTAAATSLYNDGLEISYNNAQTGKNEYLSALITDNDGGIKYYGRIKSLADAGDSNGTATVAIDGKYEKGDKLYVFNEQMNGNNKTDYSSEVVEVKVPDVIKCRITVSADPAEGGAPYSLEYECNSGASTIIEPSANLGYVFKKWDVTIGDAKITQDSDGTWKLNAGKQDVEVTAHYTYSPIDINECEFSVEDMTYTGKMLEPEVLVYYNNLYQEPGTAFTVAYSNNVKVGTGKATVTGKGPFTGEKELEFKITQQEAGVVGSKLKATLSKNEYTYNGKVRKPSVTVRDGKVIVDPAEYKVSYDSGRKNVGIYKITVKLDGNYNGTLTKEFKIKPKGTNLKSLKGKSKAVQAMWKKQGTKMSKSRITGYEILLATDSKFTKNKKTVIVKGYNNISKTVKGLKAKKKYYVKIRTYKSVKGTKVYSGWSKVKTVKTK